MTNTRTYPSEIEKYKTAILNYLEKPEDYSACYSLSFNESPWVSEFAIYEKMCESKIYENSRNKTKSLDKIFTAVYFLLKKEKIETRLFPTKDSPHTRRGPKISYYRKNQKPTTKNQQLKTKNLFPLCYLD